MAVVIAGERSGVGKTTVTLALLSFLAHQGNGSATLTNHRVQSFKVGPDYIDPMFHTAITGRPCRNLDPILTSENYVQSCFARHSQGVDYAVVEGVMGLFDGVSSPIHPFKDYGSTAHVARLLGLPVILVIDCSRLSGSVAGIAHGYRTLDPRIDLAGVILNRVGSDHHLYLLKNALEALNLPILGVLRRQEEITIPDRHLGLIPTEELGHLSSLFDRLAALASQGFNWEKLFPLLKTRSSLTPLNKGGSRVDLDFLKKKPNKITKIAIAKDKAFNFYYADNLDILSQLGAELIPWSPLTDTQLPENIQGLYFGGGFPEVFAQELGDNISVRKALQQVISQGMPTYAECGGLMYLCQHLIDFEGQMWPMVGILNTTAKMTLKLTLGYRQGTALEDSILVHAGETVMGHEFHRSQLTLNPHHPLFTLQSLSLSNSTLEGWSLKSLHASYLHLHFGEYPSLGIKFLAHCLDFFPEA